MAAGQGFKTFTTGEVLTAGDGNGYLMQGVLVFASAAARDAAITSPQEGQFAFTKDTNGLWYYDGAAWVASGATGDIEGVTAGVGISGGGTSGTVTVTNSMATAIDAKGDLVAGTGADTFAKLTVGANDTVLTADSTTATGLKWAAPAGGGANWSLLNSGGTTLSGSSSVTVSGISGKDKILIVISDASPASGSGNAFCEVRLNADSGSNYAYFGNVIVADASYVSGNFAGTNFGSTTEIKVARWSGNDTSQANAYLLFSGCNASGVKVFNASGGANAGGSNEQRTLNIGGYYAGSSTISSVSVRTSTAANFDAGTIFVYTSA